MKIEKKKKKKKRNKKKHAFKWSTILFSNDIVKSIFHSLEKKLEIYVHILTFNIYLKWFLKFQSICFKPFSSSFLFVKNYVWAHWKNSHKLLLN